MALQPYKGANTAQYYVLETTPGVTPTNPAWSILRNTGGIPAVTRDALVSNNWTAAARLHPSALVTNR